MPADTGKPERDAFLAWALERLEFRWAGYRKVRGQVHKRIARRLSELGLDDLDSYRGYLETHPEEWGVLDTLCRITISRFWRGKMFFRRLGARMLPELAVRARARGDRALKCWSAGCASGEEPYSLGLVWDLDVGPRFPELEFLVTATDSDPVMLERARAGLYPRSSLRDVPPKWIETAFEKRGLEFFLKSSYRERVEFRMQDIRREAPDGPFDLVLCRYLAFTYFAESLQKQVLARIRERLVPDGKLLLGQHEHLPAVDEGR